MTDEDHAKAIGARVSALNEALAEAKRHGLRVQIASVVEKEYGHTDRVALRDITKSLMPPPSRPVRPHKDWYEPGHSPDKEASE